MTDSRRLRSLFGMLYFQVLLAVVAGILVGWIFPHVGEELKPLSDAFIRLVKMIIGPVIFCTVVSGLGGMSDLTIAGRIGAKAIGYFLIVSTLALVVGLVVANVIGPGRGLHVDAAMLDPGLPGDRANSVHPGAVAFLLHIIPETAVSAFVSGDILQVLLISLLFAVALARAGERGRQVHALIGQLATTIFGVVHLIMKIAPAGAFGAMAFTIGKYGFASLSHLALLVGCFYLTGLMFVFGVLGLIARSAGFSVVHLLRYLKEELWLVLGTSSSESALSSLIEKLENLGIDRSVVGIVVPTGYSFNLDGTNIYMAMGALFIAQATDTPISLGDQILLLLVAMVSSKGAAGVSGSGFVTLAATLSVVPKIPVAGVAILLGVDRFMSKGRALVNFIGNAVATVVIARQQGAVDETRLRRVLDP